MIGLTQCVPVAGRRAPLFALPAGLLAPLLAAAALAAAASSPSGAQRAADAGRTLVGTAAPRIVMTTIDGQQIDLGRLYGAKAVYLKFWATWCVPCREQMPHLEHTFRTAGADLAVIAINAGFNDTLADVRDYRRRMGLSVPIVLDDGRLGAAFNLRVTPQHVVIGRDGRILYVGHLADARLDEALLAARSAALPAAAVASAAPQSTPAAVHYGVGDQLPGLAVSTLAGGTFLVGASGGSDRRIPLALVRVLSRRESPATCQQLPRRARAAGGPRRGSGGASARCGLRPVGQRGGSRRLP